MLSSRLLLLGGSPSSSRDDSDHTAARLPQNFRGCIKQAVYEADSISLDILHLARNGHRLIEISGRPLFDKCEDLAASQPISFLTEDAYILLPAWQTPLAGSLVFSFRTIEEDGLIVYGMGDDETRDFLGIEILERRLYLVIDVGFGAIKVQISANDVSDGQLHQVVVNVSSTYSSVSMDGVRKMFTSPGENHNLSLAGNLVLGGIGPNLTSAYFRKELWSAVLQKGYVGCLQDVIINGEKLNLLDISREQQNRNIGEYCRTTKAVCPSMPCLHRGLCSEGWNRHVCDCSRTEYTGPNCKMPAMTLSFDGSQYLSIALEEEASTEVEDASIRFRSKRPHGLLFATSANSSLDHMTVMLEGGQVRLDVNLDSGSKTIYAGSKLNDDEWHTVYVRRRGRAVQMQVDNGTVVSERLSSSRGALLHWANIMVAAWIPPTDDTPHELLQGDSKFVDFNALRLARRAPREAKSTRRNRDNFAGHMQKFVFNGNDYFEMARSGKIRNVRTNAHFSESNTKVNSPITFLTPSAHFTTRLRLYDTFTIFFAMKTTQPDGLIMYSGMGSSRDFMAIELFNGHLRYIFDVGSGPRAIRSQYVGRLNDNKWHDITILRPQVNQHIIRVDDVADFDHLSDSSSVHFDMEDEFYVGGITREMFSALPKLVRSRVGFQGCLASLDLDGLIRNILEKRGIPHKYRDQVLEGCDGTFDEETGPTTVCSPASCDNGGTCIQEWNSFRCDCLLTSFTGPTCTDDGIAYTFGSGGGLITYRFPQDDLPTTEKDTLSLGFITSQKDAVLLRVESESSNDYIQMELEDGNIFVVYNMGTMDHPIVELFERANDDSYHVVRFLREGPNATLQLDDLKPMTKHPIGRHMSIFNEQSMVHVGALPSGGQLSRSFHGTIAGVVLNGRRILEAAAVVDPLVTIEGDVELEVKPLRPHYSLTPLPPTPPHIGSPGWEETSTPGMHSTMGIKTGNGGGDDLVYSGMSGGCPYEDEEECLHPGSGATSADALVSPVLEIRTTPQPEGVSRTPTPHSLLSTVPSSVDEHSGDRPCEGDDEDCDGVTASGNGRTVDPNIHETSTDDIGFGEQGPPDGNGVHGGKPGSNGGPGDHFPEPTRSANQSVVEEVTEIFITENMTETIEKKKPSNPPGVSSSPTSKASPGATGNSGEVKPDKDNNNYNSLGMNIGLIVGIVAGVMVLLLVAAYALYKFRSRDEGSYKIDETKNYSYETCNTKPPPQLNGGVAKTKRHSSSKPRKKDIKEWYV